MAGLGLVFVFNYRIRETKLQNSLGQMEVEKSTLNNRLTELAQELTTLKNEDQRLRNNQLAAEITQIQHTYLDSVKTYEDLVALREQTNKTAKPDAMFSEILKYLADRNYASAAANLISLTREIQKQKEELAASFKIPQSVPVDNSPPAGGYRRQRVKAEIGEFLIDVVSGDLGSTRVIVDSASDSDCKTDCPVFSLADYISRNGGYAGINGSYFCPATYPSCTDKKNSFDTLLMNKNKKYLNSDNNVYSTIPAVIFLGGSVRFVAQSLEWGRDTGNDGVLANQPLLLTGNDIRFGGDGDPKKGSRGSRSFVGNKGNTVYIGVVHNATVAEVAHVVKTMGLDNALNLDSGGSTALWHGGYKVGPGRNIPNAIVFVRR